MFIAGLVHRPTFHPALDIMFSDVQWCSVMFNDIQCRGGPPIQHCNQRFSAGSPAARTRYDSFIAKNMADNWFALTASKFHLASLNIILGDWKWWSNDPTCHRTRMFSECWVKCWVIWWGLKEQLSAKPKTQVPCWRRTTKLANIQIQHNKSNLENISKAV